MIRHFFDSYRAAYAGLPRDIWLLSLIMLINRAGTMVLVFFVLYLTKVFEYSDQVAGAIISISAVGGILGALLGGWMSDHFGAIRSQIFFLVCTAIQFLLILMADSLFAVGFMLFGLMFFNEAVRPGLHAACLEYCAESQQKRSMGLLRLAVNLGMAIGPLVGGFMAEFNLWSWMFVVDAATCLISAIMLFLIFGTGRKPARPKQGIEQDEDQSPWRDVRMIQFGVCYLLILLVFVQVASTFIRFLEDVYQLKESEIGMLTAINPILIVALEMVVIRSVENRSAIKTIAVGALLICVGFGLLPFGNSILFCVLTVIIWTFGEILAFPISSAYVAELSTERNRGRYMSFITVLWSLAMIIGPYAGLSLYSIDRNLPWYSSLAIGIIVFPLMFRLKSQPTRPKIEIA